MKLESAHQRRPEGDSPQESDQMEKQRNKHRQGADPSPQLRLPDPPDPDNLPIEYPGPREIEWP